MDSSQIPDSFDRILGSNSHELSKRLVSKYRTLLAEERRKLSAKLSSSHLTTTAKTDQIRSHAQSRYTEPDTDGSEPSLLPSPPTAASPLHSRSGHTLTRTRASLSPRRLPSGEYARMSVHPPTLHSMGGSSRHAPQVALHDTAPYRTAADSPVSQSPPRFDDIDIDIGSGRRNGYHEDDQIEQLREERRKAVGTIRAWAEERVRHAEEKVDLQRVESEQAIEEQRLQYEATIRELTSNLKERENRLAGVKSDLSRLRESYEARSEQLKRRVKSIETERDRLSQSLVETQQKARADLRSSKAAAEERVALARELHTAEVEQLRTRSSQLAVELEEAERGRLEFLESTARDVGQLNEVVSKMRSRKEELETQCRTLRSRDSRRGGEADALRSELQAASDELRSLRQRNEALVRELKRTDKVLYGKKKHRKR